MVRVINRNIYQARADIAKALGHWIRIKIIEILDSKGEHCVCELINLIDASQSTISKHLKVLKEAGIAEAKKEGLKVYYSLKAPCIAGFFSCVDRILRMDLEKRMKQLESLDKGDKEE